MASTRILTVVLACLAMLGPFATDAYLPSFLSIGTEFEATQSMVQQTLSLYLIGFAVMSLFWGTLSDSFGRRPIILISLLLFGIGSVGSALAPSFEWLLFFRVLQGCSAGAGRVVGQALVRDRFHGVDAQRMFANITMVFSLAPAIAPVLGGYLDSYAGWRSTFVLLTVLTLALIVVCWKQLPESLAPEARQPLRLGVIFRNYLLALRHREFLLAILGVGFAFSGFALYIASAAGFVMGVLGLSETSFGWLFIPFILGMVSGSMISSKLAARVAATKFIRVGLITMTFGALVNVLYNLIWPAEVPWAVIPIFIYAMGMSMALPSMTIMVLNIFPQIRGLASSLQSAAQMTIFATVSGVVAPMVFDSALLLAIGMLGGAILCIGFWMASRQVVRCKNAARL